MYSFFNSVRDDNLTVLLCSVCFHVGFLVKNWILVFLVDGWKCAIKKANLFFLLHVSTIS